MRLSREAMLQSERPTDIAGKSIRGSGITFASQMARFLLTTLSTVVLARLLTPDDYGVVAMAAVVIGFAQVFSSVGLSAATIQRDRITRGQVDSLFWVNLAASGVIAACVVASAPLVAAFYHSPHLTAVIAALGLSFLVSGVSIQHEALLRRHMEFRSLATIQVGSQLASVAITIALALLGTGYWALVWGSLTLALVTTLLTFYYCPFVPRWPHRGSGVRSMLLFGGHLTAFDIVNYFARNADNLLIGRFLGADALGLYSRAYGLFMLPITQIRSPIMSVGMPALSALRSSPAEFRRYYSRILNVMAVLTVPLGVYCVLEGGFVVRLLLGPQWIGLIGAFRVLALIGIVQPAASTVGLVLVSQGRADRQLRIGSISSVVVVIGFIVGLHYGIEGVAIGYAVTSYALVIPNVWYSYRGSPVMFSDFARAMLPAMAASAVAASLVVTLSLFLDSRSVGASLAVSALYAVAYVGMTLARPSVRETFHVMWKHRRANADGQARAGADRVTLSKD